MEVAVRQAHGELQRWQSLLGCGNSFGRLGMATSVADIDMADVDMARTECLAAVRSAQGRGTPSMT